VFRGLNHLFQHATTGALGEYGTIEETMAPGVLRLVTSWIDTHTMRRPMPPSAVAWQGWTADDIW
jgi:hypothetical protein